MISPNSPSWLKHLDFMVIDIVSLAAAFVFAYWFKFNNFGFIDSAQWKGLMAMLLLANVVLTLFMNPYSGVFRRKYWEDVGANLKLAVASFVIACVAFYLLKIGEDYSREMLIITYLVYFFLGLLLKAIRKFQLLSRRDNPPADSFRRMIIVSTSDKALETESHVLADDMRTAEIVGFCLVDAYEAGKLGGRPTVPVEELAALAGKTNVDEVLIAVDSALVGSITLENLIEDGARVRFALEESLGVSSETQSLARAGVMKTVDLERYSFGSGQMIYLPLKRLCDIAFGILGCVITLPVAAIVKLSYLAAGDKSPIFYTQQRIGQRGVPFKMYKIRSMVSNADEVLKELLKDPEKRAEWERDQKFSDDPRVTPVGRVLRRTSLDELPQFYNVLKGDMSVVGPRPLVPGELEEHGGRSLYNKVKPGITGWWGCNGRSNIDYRERLELEYHYVKHCSLYMDVLCIFRTLVAVLKKEGAK